jgi:hypothetical protein
MQMAKTCRQGGRDATRHSGHWVVTQHRCRKTSSRQGEGESRPQQRAAEQGAGEARTTCAYAHLQGPGGVPSTCTWWWAGGVCQRSLELVARQEGTGSKSSPSACLVRRPFDFSESLGTLSQPGTSTSSPVNTLQISQRVVHPPRQLTGRLGAQERQCRPFTFVMNNYARDSAA